MSNAPVCNINPPLPTAEPTTPDLPAIPVATDLASLIQAVNTIANIIRTMTNQNSDNAGFPPYFISTKTNDQKKKNANFQEIVSKRTFTITTVKDPNSSASVKVKQITGLTFINKVTNQEILWKR